MSFSEKFNKFIEFLFPLNHTCNVCGKEVFKGEYFCKDCEEKFVYNNKIICNHCGRKTFNSEEYCFSCSGRDTFFEKARSCFIYQMPIKQLIVQLKYNHKKYIAKILAKYLAFSYYQNFFNCDTVVYTPMTKEREKQRGYNQARILAEQFCKITKLNINHDCLVKVKETARQASILNSKERYENLKGSFKIINKQKIVGKRLLIIDDVMTTGATVELISEQLLKAGASAVCVLTVASVSKGPEGKISNGENKGKI